MSSFKLGRKKSIPDRRTLRFRDYLTLGRLTPEKPPVDWYSEVYNWPMYSNDTLGCCVISALGHLGNLWSKYSTGVEGGPTDAEVVTAYKVLSPDDDGVDILTALQYMDKTGIGGHRIAAYVALDPGDLIQAKLCVDIFGAVLIGLELPDAITNAENMLGIQWDVPEGASTTSGEWAPDPNNGHCVILPGYLTSGLGAHFPMVTWGQMAPMSDNFYQAYSDEAYGLVSADWLRLNGRSPSGYNISQLLADRAVIANS